MSVLLLQNRTQLPWYVQTLIINDLTLAKWLLIGYESKVHKK